jgi:hypothetical protein
MLPGPTPTLTPSTPRSSSAVARGHVAGDDLDVGERLAHLADHLEHALAVAVRGVDHQQVHMRVDQRSRALLGVGGDADRRPDAEPAKFILAGVREVDLFLDVLDGDQSLEAVVLVDHRELLDTMPVEQFLGFVERRADRDGREVVGRHQRRHRLVRVGDETQVAVGEDADELPVAVGDRQPGDAVALHLLERLGDRLVRRQRDRVDDHPRLAALDLVDLLGLRFDRQVLVHDPDAALLGDRDRQGGLGHGVHRGRQERDVEVDPASQPGMRLHLAGQDRTRSRHQQDIVERQPFRYREFDHGR